MLLEAQNSQFKLIDDGGICYQPQASNPLPGELVAKLVKGEHPLKPQIVLVDHAILADMDKAQVQTRIEAWLEDHLKAVLELLMALDDAEGLISEPCKTIAAKLYDAMGIIPREEIEPVIAALDTEMRKELRAKRVRLGPILVFIPALNKPAAVRLRALLWGLYHGKDLPLVTPKDGIVSFTVEEAFIDKSFYQAICYPVYGGRAIRIDMLDRVISAVYDGADKGQFKAEHKMAEWLGSSIEGLYAVLMAMGHTKIHDPAEEAAKAEAGAADTVDVSLEALKAAEEAAAPVVEPVAHEEKKPEVRPELATFRLKKGKAFETGDGKSGFKKPAQNSDKKFKAKPKKKDAPKKGQKPQDRSPRIMSAEAKKRPEDNPFAILQQLKK